MQTSSTTPPTLTCQGKPSMADVSRCSTSPRSQERGRPRTAIISPKTVLTALAIASYSCDGLCLLVLPHVQCQQFLRPRPGRSAAIASTKIGAAFRRTQTTHVAAQAPDDNSDVNSKDDDDTDTEVNPNLYQVMPVPTYEEMLAWAKATDERIAAGELPPLGSGRRIPAREAGDRLTKEERAQMSTVSELLSKRRRQDCPLSEEEESSLRAALDGVTASVRGPDGQSTEDRLDAMPLHPDVEGQAGSDGVAPNPFYGSREVRDKVYLYAWSLMKRNQEAFKARKQDKKQD